MSECMKHPMEICPLSLCKGHWITQAGKMPFWVLNTEMGGLVWSPVASFLECFWICSPGSHQP